MKTNKKALLTVLCALLLVVASVMGTLAFLTDSESVLNTFTVGNVDIKLDEADLSTDAADDRTEDGNAYKLYPGGEYIKDPMVTVLEGSDESYVRMIVTISNIDAVKQCFGNDFLPQYFCEGWDATTWLTQGVKEENGCGVYEFWYKETVSAPNGDVELDALFDKIVIDDEIDSDAFAKLANGLTITVEAHAIQADGFIDENNNGSAQDEAWAKFTK